MFFTPDTTNQDLDTINVTSCSFCKAKPMEWCTTKGGYMAQECHRARRDEMTKRLLTPPSSKPDWSPIIPSMSRVITIEVIVPRDGTARIKRMVDDALDILRHQEGFAEVTGTVHVEQSMDEASEILKRRSIEYG